MTRTITNQYKQDIPVSVSWAIPKNSPWDVTPVETSFDVRGGESHTAIWKLKCDITSDISSLKLCPSATVTAKISGGPILLDHKTVPLSVEISNASENH